MRDRYKEKGHNNWHIVYRIIFGFFTALMFASLICEMRTSKGLLQCILDVPYIKMCHYEAVAIFRASTIADVINFIGFGGIVLSIVQMLNEKTVYGVHYAELVKYKYPGYWWILGVQLVASVLCMVLSSAGSTEGSILTLIVVVLGLVFLWNSMVSVAFNSANRARIAGQLLRNQIARAAYRKEDFSDKVDNLATELSLCSSLPSLDLTKSFAFALVKYVQPVSADSSKNIVKTSAQFWLKALTSYGILDRRIVARQIFLDIIDIIKCAPFGDAPAYNCKYQIVVRICCGFILANQWMLSVANNPYEDTSRVANILKVDKELRIFSEEVYVRDAEQRYDGVSIASVVECMCSICKLLCWQLFIDSKIALYGETLADLPKDPLELAKYDVDIIDLLHCLDETYPPDLPSRPDFRCTCERLQKIKSHKKS